MLSSLALMTIDMRVNSSHIKSFAVDRLLVAAVKKISDSSR